MESLTAQQLISLDSKFLSRTFVPKTIYTFIAEVARTRDQSSKMMKLGEYITKLEDEMKKIDAFRRELPLCMLLVNDAVVMMKDELVKCKKLNPEPMLEEFIPLNKGSYGHDKKDEKVESVNEKDVRDKMNWMSSVQLWSSDDNDIKGKHEETNRSMLNMEFVPLKGCNNIAMAKEDKHKLREVLPRLSLRMPETENLIEGVNGDNYNNSRLKSSFSRSNMNCGEQKTVKKKRRCWSPELHRRFISSLEQLGGPQVATPKQIRELMQVDGLSNDEVKSHLQKYRLHLRKVHKKTRGLWIGDSSKQITETLSCSPEGPLHLNGFSGTNGGDSFEDNGEDEKSERINLSRTEV